MTSLNLATLTFTSSGLTTATTAYGDGDQLGAIIAANLGAGCILTDAVLTDKSNIVGAVDCFVFDRSVTLAADNAPGPAVSDADSLFQLGVIEFPYPKLEGNNRMGNIDSLAKALIANAATTVYLALVTRSAHTFFGAATDLQVRLSFSKDV